MDTRISKFDIYIYTLFYAIALPISFFDSDFTKGILEPIADTFIYFFFSFIVSYLVVYKVFPYCLKRKQIILMLIIISLLLLVFGFFELISYAYIASYSIDVFEYKQLMIWGLTTSSENAGILIGVLLGTKFYQSQIDIQKKEKEKREHELRSLKAQIDPHFLFNNLNTVDALIDSDPTGAKAYINNLSQLYRYLIRTKDDDVVEIDKELQFAKNYIYLIEKRFGTAYQFELEIEATEERFIPPGALQTVLENVVKHNTTANHKPIITKICISNDRATIINNIQRKTEVGDKSETGLNNLKARYRLLTDQKITIIENESYMIVLPLLKAIVG